MNRLASEQSAYLQMHAKDPVDWYPWGDEAFARAAELGRPLFISIGFSACHWCHVMARESFADHETAARLNEEFVAIKVDREERPDVDAIYLEAVQSLSGRGGWPLTVFATPDGHPFYGGTYLPKSAKSGATTFLEALETVLTAWTNRRDELLDSAAQLIETIALRLAPPTPRARSDGGASALLNAALDRFDALHDPDYGGIGRASKFPQAPIHELVLRSYLLGRTEALDKVLVMLDHMAAGGIYDQIGGGFARYAVDRTWRIPHFEKMLYDQAALARLYLHSWQIAGDARFYGIFRETLDYAVHRLSDPRGGLRSSEDADSEDGEGAYYTWTLDEFEAVLGAEEARFAAEYFGVTAKGNREDGRSVLSRPPARPPNSEPIDPKRIERWKEHLLRARDLRPHPKIDSKVITEWNAMICSVLAEAAGATGELRWKQAAIRVGNFLLESLRRKDGRWLRCWQADGATQLATAADYVWLVECFTRLAECTGERKWLDEACSVADGLISLFGAEDGGWFITGSDAPTLIIRPRDTYDNTTPASSSVAAGALGRLGALVGNENLIERAAATIASARDALTDSPLSIPDLVGATLSIEHGFVEVVVSGNRPDLVDAVRHEYRPDVVLVWGERTNSPLWQGRVDDRAYVCRAGVCLSPVSTVDELLSVLNSLQESSSQI